MRTVRSSPSYWQWKKLEMNAMIRQLGCASFFITLSPNEINWPELLVLLVKVLEHKTISEEDAMKLTKDEKIKLISRDPFTTARYFENRIGSLLKYMNAPQGSFADNPIRDYFWRIEFNKRGAPHVHMLVWNQDAPIYDAQMEKGFDKDQLTAECIQFIDKYITCHRPDDDIVRSDHSFEANSGKVINTSF